MSNNEEKKAEAILIGEDAFLINFHDEFLNKLSITPWTKEKGLKDRLQNVERDSLQALFIQADLSYSYDSLICWIRTLRCGGVLCLEANLEYSPKVLEEKLNFLVKLVNTPNKAVWIFQKKALPSAQELFSDVSKMMHAKVDEATLWQALEKLEMREPFEVSSTYIRSVLLSKYQINFPVFDYWKRFTSIKPSLSMEIFASLIHLSMGNYTKGFHARELVLKDYHPRRTKVPPKAEWIAKRWEGEPLEGKTIVIWTEFGLGDELMFAQLAYYLKKRGAAVVKLIAQAPIVSILRTHPDIDQVIPEKEVNEQIGEFDYWVYPHAILSHSILPFDEVPKRLPYLFAKNKQIEQFAPLFTHNGKLKVGLVWKGNPTHENDHYRSIHELRYVEELLQMDCIDWYCFQKDCNEEERQLLEKYKVPHIARDFKDFSETAGALSHIDLLVAVDTSIVHLAGAMNIPTLLLQPYIVDWRWGLTGKDNFWYSSVKSYRNISPDYDWTPVIQEVKDALSARGKQYSYECSI